MIPRLRQTTLKIHILQKNSQAHRIQWLFFSAFFAPQPFLHFSSEKNAFSFKWGRDLRIKKLKTLLLFFIMLGFCSLLCWSSIWFGFFLISHTCFTTKGCARQAFEVTTAVPSTQCFSKAFGRGSLTWQPVDHAMISCH